MARTRAPRRPLWLIARHENGRMGVLTLESGSESEALPVFSYEEEAETFLRLGTPGADWRARKFTGGELVSLLNGPYAGVNKVALDPLPVLGYEMVLDIAGSRREEFLQNFAGEPSTLQGGRADMIISPELTERAQERAAQTPPVPDYVVRDFGASESLREDSEGQDPVSGVPDPGEDLE